jgi:AraC-like DNA-binding protein
MDRSHVEFAGSLPGLEVLRITRSSHVFPRHFHDGLYAIGLMHSGVSNCLGTGKDDAELNPGQTCLINPGQVHSGVPARDSAITYTMLYLDLALVQGLAEDLSRRPLPAPEFTTLICGRRDLYESLRRLALSLGRGSTLEAESALVRSLADVLRIHGGVSRDACGHDRSFIGRAREMLAADLDLKVTIRDMAAELGVSQYHFLRTFKRRTGVPPHVFRTQRRVELARQLVRRGTPLSEVAQLTGFTDQSHFTNTFKLYTGATPGQYAAGFARSGSRRYGDTP